MILHNANTDLEAIQPLFAEKHVRFETAFLDESGIKKLVYCDGVIFLGQPIPTMLIMLREILGRRLLPSKFPVFLNSETTVPIPNNQGLGSLDIISGYDSEKCNDKATGYRSRKASTGSYLGWATLLLMFVLFFLGLKGAKVFLPSSELETQVENLKVNDPTDIYLRLLGPTSKLKERLALFNKLASHPDFYFLPLDLSMFLISRRNETQSYLDRVQALLEIPFTLKVYTVAEIEATLLKISQLKDRFPKKWETTEAWAFLLNKETLNQELLKELLAFYADFNKRNDVFNHLSGFSEKQKLKGFDWKPWMETTAVFLQDPWPTSSYFALSTNIPEILEMRLADYRNREKIRILKSSIQFLTSPRNSSLQDFLFKTDDAKLAFETLEKNSPDWRNLQKQLTPLQKDVIESLAKTLKQKVYDLCTPLIYEILGDQKTWQSSCNKLLTNPKIISISNFLIPLEFYSSGFTTDPLNHLITFLKQEVHLIKTNKINLKIDEKIFAMLPDSPALKISFINNNGENTEFNAKLLPEKDNPLQFSCILNLNTVYKLNQKVRAELSLNENYLLLWEKPLLEPFGWTVMKTPAKLLLGNEVLNLGKMVELSFEPPLPLIPELLLNR